MAKFTPGEWTIEPGDDGDDSVGLKGYAPSINVEIPDGDVISICTLSEPCYRADVDPTDEYDEGIRWSGTLEGNGNLIIAAPDYHAAAAKLLACPVDSDGFAEGLEMLRAAQAKADGGDG